MKPIPSTFLRNFPQLFSNRLERFSFRFDVDNIDQLSIQRVKCEILEHQNVTMNNLCHMFGKQAESKAQINSSKHSRTPTCSAPSPKHPRLNCDTLTPLPKPQTSVVHPKELPATSCIITWALPAPASSPVACTFIQGYQACFAGFTEYRSSDGVPRLSVQLNFGTW
jgi:hypothetical protein